jgi:hypothetical protein
MRRSVILSVLGAATLAGCGGGTPTPSPTPTPANRAPAFTSAATASVVENIAAALTAGAVDPDGDSLIFSIAGGTDAARFAITSAGALTFASAPNYDLPGDANGDNVYQVQLRVSDGSLSATQDATVTVTNSREGIVVRLVGAGFTQPLYVTRTSTGSQWMYVVEKGGDIYTLDPPRSVRRLERTVTNLSTDGERGLLGLAINTNAPATYGEALVLATAPDGAVELRSYPSLSNWSIPYNVVLRTPHPTNNNHNGGWLGFGPDGHLYVGIGDGGGAGDPNNNAQNPNVRLGKILRLAQSGGSYVPAPGNPYIAGGGDPWVFALGLRNPYRASFAPDGRLFIGDVGEGAREEINVVRPDQPGLNFGWRFLEGTLPFSGTAPAGLTPPVIEYSHGSGPRQGRSVIGGYVYRGPVDSLRGSYIFADFMTGNIWSIPAASIAAGTTLTSSSFELRTEDFSPAPGNREINQIVSFGEDAAGNLFIVDFDGEIFRVTAS